MTIKKISDFNRFASKDQRGFDHKATHYIRQPCITPASTDLGEGLQRQIRPFSPKNSCVNVKPSYWSKFSLGTSYIRHISSKESYLKTGSCIISCWWWIDDRMITMMTACWGAVLSAVSGCLVCSHIYTGTKSWLRDTRLPLRCCSLVSLDR